MSRACTWWCENRADGHFVAGSPCEYMVSGVESDPIPQHGHVNSQFWVSAVRDISSREQMKGVQVCVNVADETGGGWRDEFVKSWLRSGDARTLAAQLIAAADVIDGITVRPGQFGGDW